MADHMIDPNAIPIRVYVGSMLKALAKQQAEAFVVFRDGNRVITAGNTQQSLVLAKNALLNQEAAIETAAVVLHGTRIVPDRADEAAVQAALCSVVVCAGHELAKGGQQTWEDLPDAIKDAHRALVKSVVGAVIAYQAPQQQGEESRIVKPV